MFPLREPGQLAIGAGTMDTMTSKQIGNLPLPETSNWAVVGTSKTKRFTIHKNKATAMAIYTEQKTCGLNSRAAQVLTTQTKDCPPALTTQTKDSQGTGDILH